MTPRKFDYYAPGSLSEAVSLLDENEDAKILAGGQSLLALMKLRLASPSTLIDITGLHDELAYIREERGYLAIGALASHDALESNDIIRERFPLLSDAAGSIGDQQIRNMGTIGGSCCHADPAADLPAAVLALDAQFVVSGKRGRRAIPPSEFFIDTFTTSIAKDEILIELRIPYLPARTGSAYLKHSSREGDFAIVGVGVALTVNERKVKDARIGLSAVAPRPIRASAAESFLKGKVLNQTTIADAAKRASEGADPPSDIHGGREYRMEMIEVFTRRTFEAATTRMK